MGAALETHQDEISTDLLEDSDDADCCVLDPARKEESLRRCSSETSWVVLVFGAKYLYY